MAADFEPVRISKEFNHFTSPVWSPDGARLAYAWEKVSYLRDYIISGISLYDVVTGAITSPQGLGMIPGLPDEAIVRSPNWALDQASLLVVVNDARWQVQCDQPLATVVAPDLPVGTYRAPTTWSPDGRDQIVLSIRGGQPDLWIQRVATGEWWQLTDDARYELDPDWSPDGTKIAYVWDGPIDQELVITSDPRTVGVEPVSFSAVKALFR